MNRSQIKERTQINTFIKVINQIHLMPTRYKIDLRLGDISVKSLNPKESNRKKLRQNVRRKLTRMYFRNCKPSTRWFFRKLYF